MSTWAVRIPRGRVGDAESTIAQAVADAELGAHVDGAAEGAAKVAINAVRDLLASGLAGGVDNEFQATVSGHANPGGRPAHPGIGPDTVTIVIEGIMPEWSQEEMDAYMATVEAPVEEQPGAPA